MWPHLNTGKQFKWADVLQMYSPPNILNANLSACDRVCSSGSCLCARASLFKTRRNDLLWPSRNTPSGIQIDWVALSSLTFHYRHRGGSRLSFPLEHTGEYKWVTHWTYYLFQIITAFIVHTHIACVGLACVSVRLSFK